MHRVREKSLLLLVVLFAFVSVASAEVGGKITGVVKDQTGSVIAGPPSSPPTHKHASN
jgi:hypothetical protein